MKFAFAKFAELCYVRSVKCDVELVSVVVVSFCVRRHNSVLTLSSAARRCGRRERRPVDMLRHCWRVCYHHRGAWCCGCWGRVDRHGDADWRSSSSHWYVLHVKCQLSSDSSSHTALYCVVIFHMSHIHTHISSLSWTVLPSAKNAYVLTGFLRRLVTVALSAPYKYSYLLTYTGLTTIIQGKLGLPGRS